MNTVWKMAAIGFGLLFLSGCAAHIDDYADSTPTLKLEEFFNGPLIAYGMVQDRSGKVTQRFEVEMVGTWEGNEGVLDEQFVWDDWMYLLDEQRLLNKTEMRYFGFRVGEITLYIERKL